MLLILDLDETLLFSTTTRLEEIPDYLVGEYYVYCRPGLREFLGAVTPQFRLAVWTSSSPAYAKRIVPRVFPGSLSLEFMWTRDQCTREIDQRTGETSWFKDLRKVKAAGYNPEDSILIDDRPCIAERDIGNHLQVEPYLGSQDDHELALLVKYLDMLKSAPDVRAIDKREWRSRAQSL